MKKIAVNVTIDEDLNGWLEGMAKELRMNKSQFMNNVISSGRDDIKVLKAIGAFWLARLLSGGEKRVPKINPKKISVNMTIDEDLDEWLEGMAKELRMNKSQFANNIIAAMKDDVKVLKAVGVFSLGKMVMKVKEKVLDVEIQGTRLVDQKGK
jgi:hypothetical protein